MRCQPIKPDALGSRGYHVPDGILREAAPPDVSPTTDSTEDFALSDARGAGPLVQRLFYPKRHRNRANVAAFAYEVHNCPMPLARLHALDGQRHQLRAAQSAAKQNRHDCPIALRTGLVTADHT